VIERFDIENRIDELSRLHCTQERIHKISALPDNLIPSHRVENGAPYRIDPLFVGFATLQLYFHDRHELRIEPFKLLVRRQFYLGALANDCCIPNSRLIVRSERKRFCRPA
jgi:hypothetical protein